jgi:hypothetical protein
LIREVRRGREVSERFLMQVVSVRGRMVRSRLA